MQIGIEFFDGQDPKPGDLWIVASGPAMGKSTVLRNIAVGIADNLSEGRIAYWDLEQTPTVWRQRIEAMGCAVPAAFDYRNDSAYQDGYADGKIIPALNIGAGASTRVVVLDHFGLFTENVADALKTLKTWLVRTAKFGIVSLQLPREIWGKLKAEGQINPDSLPEHMLDHGDAVLCAKLPPDCATGCRTTMLSSGTTRPDA
jgi:hypothetical protein